MKVPLCKPLGEAVSRSSHSGASGDSEYVRVQSLLVRAIRPGRRRADHLAVLETCWGVKAFLYATVS